MAEEEMCAHAKEDVKKAMDMAQPKFMAAEEQVKGIIKRDPVNAAMFAAGVGFLAGLAIACAIMSKRHGYTES